MSRGATQPMLLQDFDGLLVDLDGTLYQGDRELSGAVQAMRTAREVGLAVRYVTNNASRAVTEVARRLVDRGFPATAAEVSTSAQAAADVLSDRLPAGAPVLVIGTSELVERITAVGMTAVRQADDRPSAVVQGHSPDTGWRQLSEGCLAVRAGALWVACNTDPTLVSERGQLAGNGAMVAALRTATGMDPVVAGKPQRPLMERAASDGNMQVPLVVGDRMDTDIAGGHAIQAPGLLVLSGVDGPREVLAAPARHRPTYLGRDVGALLSPSDRSAIAAVDGWRVTVSGDELELGCDDASVSRRADPELDALRSMCQAWWSVAGNDGAQVQRLHAGDSRARSVLRHWDLAHEGGG